MSRKRYTPEKIIGMIREAEVVLAQGVTVGHVCRQLSISEQTYYRCWRNRKYNDWTQSGPTVKKFRATAN
jgi:transposase-like protein